MKNRRPILFILILLLIFSVSRSQNNTYSFYQLYQLDSIGRSSSPGRYFGALYFDFLQLVEARLHTADTTTQRLVRHFEAVFAQFYIDACIANKNNQSISLPAWKAYFTDTTLSPAQYELLGANAHLNGGLAEAIAGSYTPEEWKYLKKKYILFNYCLNKTYNQVHRRAVLSSKRAAFLDKFTLGLDKILGQYYLYKWRKRQMRLTELYFSGSPHYSKLLAKVNRKKERIDRMVFTQL